MPTVSKIQEAKRPSLDRTTRPTPHQMNVSSRQDSQASGLDEQHAFRGVAQAEQVLTSAAACAEPRSSAGPATKRGGLWGYHWGIFLPHPLFASLLQLIPPHKPDVTPKRNFGGRLMSCVLRHRALSTHNHILREKIDYNLSLSRVRSAVMHSLFF